MQMGWSNIKYSGDFIKKNTELKLSPWEFCFSHGGRSEFVSQDTTGGKTKNS